MYVPYITCCDFLLKLNFLWLRWWNNQQQLLDEPGYSIWLKEEQVVFTTCLNGVRSVKLMVI